MANDQNKISDRSADPSGSNKTHCDPGVQLVAGAHVGWDWDDERKCLVDSSTPSRPIYLHPSVRRDDALMLAMLAGMSVEFHRSGYGAPDCDGYVLCRIDSADVECVEPYDSSAVDALWRQGQAFCAAVVWCACQAELEKAR